MASVRPLSDQAKVKQGWRLQQCLKETLNVFAHEIIPFYVSTLQMFMHDLE
jgi:hypothetical protein